jgi:hypothetical protein
VILAGASYPSYSFVGEQIKAAPEKASGAASFWRVSGNFCSAPFANSDFTDHELVFAAGPEEGEEPERKSPPPDSDPSAVNGCT